jgi:flavin-dependent dehydrogenase
VKHYDIIIMGGGIAGGFLTRHLRLVRPELSVLCLEAAETMADRKVGESTVEVAAHYMVRRLGLGTYLYQHQLPKNGLRFFFDNEAKSLPLERMSEIGADHLPFHPSFQVERASLERDLVVMNRAAGAEVELGAKVTDLSVNGETGHTVSYTKDGAPQTVSGRWLIDASGRRQLLARQLDHRIHKETRLATGAAWGRYVGVAGLDALGDEAWRARVRHTSRHLSTNHMMYDGYWLWFIPLAGDLMSVGAVFDKDRIQGPRTRGEFETFMRSHRSSRDLLEGATLDDFQSYNRLPYHVDTFFSADRWAMTGEAGAFVDPFYSPGSDFIAVANELIVAMIETDLDEGRSALAEKVDASNQFYRFKYESTLGIYEGMYPGLGSYEVMRLKYRFDFNNYYNLIVWPFMADKLRDTAWIREELRMSERICQGIRGMGRHFATMAAHLRERGEYFARNEGEWANGLGGVEALEPRLGPVLDGDFRRGEVDRVFGSVFAGVLARVAEQPSLARRERVLSELGFAHVTLFKEITDATLAAFLGRVSARLTRDVRRELPDAGIERVVIDLAAVERLEVVGPAPRTTEHSAAVALATALWDAERDPLLHPPR